MSNPYIISLLLDHFHVSLDQISNLTEWQIKNLYFAKRNVKTGEIQVPKPEPKPEPILATAVSPETPPKKDAAEWDEYFQSFNTLMNVYSTKLLPRAEYDKAMSALKRKYSHLQTSKSVKKADSSEARTRLEGYLAQGILTQEQFDQAIAALND